MRVREVMLQAVLIACQILVKGCHFFKHYYQTDSTDSRTINVFILLNGWICLHDMLD